MSNILLVLGAGLGIEYGFPDGPQLRQLVLKKLDSHYDKNLHRIFQIHGSETVDEIAKCFPTYADMIKQTVAEILYECEKKDLAENSEKIYAKLFFEIYEGQKIGHKYKIITFNYDRSINYIFHLQNQIVREPECKIDLDMICAAYGRLPLLDFERPKASRRLDYHYYGRGLGKEIPSSVSLGHASSEAYKTSRYDAEARRSDLVSSILNETKLNFVGETSLKPSEVETRMTWAEKIYFLGFGYHSMNMNALGLEAGKPESAEKIFAGTGFNLDSDERADIMADYPCISRIEPCKADVFIKRKIKLRSG